MPSCARGPRSRATSPVGDSTFTTSAPKSASRSVAYGPETTVVRSTTRTPSSGRPDTRGVYAGLFDGRLRGAVHSPRRSLRLLDCRLMAGTMEGRTVLITGGNTGLGLETAVALAREGAPVVITSRDAQKGEVARTEIRERSGSDDVEVVELDLATLASVRDFAPRFAEIHDHLDVLVNNAGVMLGSRRETVDGYEMTFQVNHLGPFLLTNRLRDLLVAGNEARVVNVASAAHSGARRGLDFDDLQAKG